MTIEIPEGFAVNMVGLRADGIEIVVHVLADGRAFGYVHKPDYKVEGLCGHEEFMTVSDAMARSAEVLREHNDAPASCGPVDVDADGRPVEPERAAE